MITRPGGGEEVRHGCTETGKRGVDRDEAQWDQITTEGVMPACKGITPWHFSAPASQSTNPAPKAPVSSLGELPPGTGLGAPTKACAEALVWPMS